MLKRMCKYCGGDGHTLENPNYCKYCNTYAKQFNPLAENVENITHQLDDSTISILNTLSKQKFSLNDLDVKYKHLISTQAYINFRTHLQNLITGILQGELSTSSYLIYLKDSNLLDNLVSAYLVTAVRNKFKIFPYIDTLMLHDMLEDRNLDINGCKFKDALHCDVICVRITTTALIYKTFTILHYIIKARATLGKPTLVFTDISGESLFSKNILEKVTSASRFKDLIKSPKTSNVTHQDLIYLGLKV